MQDDGLRQLSETGLVGERQAGTENPNPSAADVYPSKRRRDELEPAIRVRSRSHFHRFHLASPRNRSKENNPGAGNWLTLFIDNRALERTALELRHQGG